MKVEVRNSELSGVEADLLVVGLCEDEALPAEIADVAGAADAKGAFKKLSLIHPGTLARTLIVGLGKREELDPERLRIAAAVAAKGAAELEAVALTWALPESGDEEAAAEALVTGTILGSYRFDRFKGSDGDAEPAPHLEALTLLAPGAVAAGAEAARVYAEAQNRARDLQSTPANVATPSFLAARAEEIAAGSAAVSAEVFGREEIVAKGMGGLAAVSQGGDEDPRLIVLRYSGGGSGPTLGLVGKGVTFDTGGISLKPASRHGGDEVRHVRRGGGAGGGRRDRRAASRPIDVVARRARDREHALRQRAIKPGDVITQYNGKTVEVNNTDAEGRLILADALAYAVELGARADRRPRHPDRRRRDRPRIDLRRRHLQRRRARR